MVHVALDVLGHEQWSAVMTSLNDRAVGTVTRRCSKVVDSIA